MCGCRSSQLERPLFTAASISNSDGAEQVERRSQCKRPEKDADSLNIETITFEQFKEGVNATLANCSLQVGQVGSFRNETEACQVKAGCFQS